MVPLDDLALGIAFVLTFLWLFFLRKRMKMNVWEVVIVSIGSGRYGEVLHLHLCI
ncbi:MAG: hypothetical protein ACI32C_02690 [Candidatus Enteromonas sp.]